MEVGQGSSFGERGLQDLPFPAHLKDGLRTAVAAAAVRDSGLLPADIGKSPQGCRLHIVPCQNLFKVLEVSFAGAPGSAGRIGPQAAASCTPVWV